MMDAPVLVHINSIIARSFRRIPFKWISIFRLAYVRMGGRDKEFLAMGRGGIDRTKSSGADSYIVSVIAVISVTTR
jgi:hypothetical protein